MGRICQRGLLFLRSTSTTLRTGRTNGANSLLPLAPALLDSCLLHPDVGSRNDLIATPNVHHWPGSTHRSLCMSLSTADGKIIARVGWTPKVICFNTVLLHFVVFHFLGYGERHMDVPSTHRDVLFFFVSSEPISSRSWRLFQCMSMRVSKKYMYRGTGVGIAVQSTPRLLIYTEKALEIVMGIVTSTQS